MSAGDKNILAFANRNSLQHKQTRAYGAGAVCISDGLFYEANNDIDAGTAFAEGDTGQTWKLVGSKPIEDWSGTGANYKEKDQVFYLGSLLECKTDNTATTFNPEHWTVKVVGDPVEWVGSIAYPAGTRVYYKKSLWAAKSDIASSVTTFDKASWDLVGGIVNELDFDFGDVTLNGVNYPSLVPASAFGVTLGSDERPFAAAVVEGINFYSGTTYLGNIDADLDSLGIYSGTSTNTTKTLKLGSQNNSGDIVISDSKIDISKNMDFNNKDIRGANRLVFNDGGKNEGVCFPTMALAEEGTGRLAIYFGNLPDFDSGSGYGVAHYNIEKTFFSPDSNYNGDINLGTSARKWKTVYASSSTINTSDEREKSFVDIPEKLLDVWFDYVKPKMYKWNSDIEKHGGSAAEIHTGVVAQDVIKAFLAADLNWTEYAIIDVDFENSNVDKDIIDYKDIDNLPPLSVRYDHVEIIEMAAIRRRLGV